MEVSGQLHAPAASPQGKSPSYQFDRRLGGPQSRSGRGGEEEINGRREKRSSETLFGESGSEAVIL
jgi:hypothetical protein